MSLSKRIGIAAAVAVCIEAALIALHFLTLNIQHASIFSVAFMLLHEPAFAVFRAFGCDVPPFFAVIIMTGVWAGLLFALISDVAERRCRARREK